MPQPEIQDFLLSSKIKLESHQAARCQRCKCGWQIISLSFPQHSFWAVISVYFVTIAARNHVSCFPYFPCRVRLSFICSQAGITLSSYFSAFTARDRAWGATILLQPCNHAGLGSPKKKLPGWQEMWIEFSHQTAGWGMVFVYCERRSEDVGEGEEGRASFTPECRSWFLREECGHRRPAFLLCAHLSLWGINWSIQTQRRTVCVLLGFFLFYGRLRNYSLGWRAGQRFKMTQRGRLQSQEMCGRKRGMP